MSLSQPNMRKPVGLNFSDFTKAATKPPSATPAFDIKFPLYQNSQSTGTLKMSGEEYDFKAEDLADQGEIGRGAYGSVNKMVFKKNNRVMAVKRIRSTVDEREQKSLLMDLEVIMKSKGFPSIGKTFQYVSGDHQLKSIHYVCSQLLRRNIQGRRLLDMHGVDGHQRRQVLQVHLLGRGGTHS